jgi:hypothetical protein
MTICTCEAADGFHSLSLRNTEIFSENSDITGFPTDTESSGIGFHFRNVLSDGYLSALWSA